MNGSDEFSFLKSCIMAICCRVLFGQPVKQLHGEATTVISQLSGAAVQMLMVPMFYLNPFPAGESAAFFMA